MSDLTSNRESAAQTVATEATGTSELPARPKSGGSGSAKRRRRPRSYDSWASAWPAFCEDSTDLEAREFVKEFAKIEVTKIFASLFPKRAVQGAYEEAFSLFETEMRSIPDYPIHDPVPVFVRLKERFRLCFPAWNIAEEMRSANSSRLTTTDELEKAREHDPLRLLVGREERKEREAQRTPLYQRFLKSYRKVREPFELLVQEAQNGLRAHAERLSRREKLTKSRLNLISDFLSEQWDRNGYPLCLTSHSTLPRTVRENMATFNHKVGALLIDQATVSLHFIEFVTKAMESGDLQFGPTEGSLCRIYIVNHEQDKETNLESLNVWFSRKADILHPLTSVLDLYNNTDKEASENEL